MDGMVAAAESMAMVPSRRGASHVPRIPASAERYPDTRFSVGVIALEHREVDRIGHRPHHQRIGKLPARHPLERQVEREVGREVEHPLPLDRHTCIVPSSRWFWYSIVPSTYGVLKSPNEAPDMANEPVYVGCARVPAMPSVAVMVPPTPAVSRSSSA